TRIVSPHAGGARANAVRDNGSRAPRAWSAADTLQRSAGSSRRSGRIIALASLAAAAIAAVVLSLGGLGGPRRAASTSGSGRSHSQAATLGGRSTTGAVAHSRRQTVASTQRRHAAATGSHASPSPSQQSTSTTAPPTQPPSADQLQLIGYQEMLDKNYPAAIATLRKAVGMADPNTLTYAYGLYNLGRSLLLAGDPQDAIPILEQRYQIPNQTSTVLDTLNDALREAGRPEIGAAPSDSEPPGQASSHGHGHSGGATLGPPGSDGDQGPGPGSGDEHTNLVD
ncbi:MAG: tetratricopeptide repeat protein, partial [Solirubrobacteraceae bacterium]